MTYWTGKKLYLVSLIAFVAIVAIVSTGPTRVARADRQSSPNLSDDGGTAPDNPNLTTSVFVPLLYADHPWESPFGVEARLPLLTSNTLLGRATDLQLGFARMGNQISWRKLQTNPGDPIQWSQLVNFEEELRGLKAAGIRPVVVIKDTPYWALDPVKARDANGNLTSCGAIHEDYFDDFAAFLTQVVNRYKTAEFNVLDWEIGNEPDVDPTQVPTNYVFGCWGDKFDKYYGGEQYGRMLTVVAPAIRQADSRASIWIGGLLLASPASNPIDGMPELFLKGILEAGAAPHFDIVPYHWYPSFWDAPGGPLHDYDNAGGSPWDAWGGGVIGKARYLRQQMADYGFQKPVFLNETGFACSEKNNDCLPPQTIFFDSQSSHLVRFYVRGLSEGVSGMIWYTLDGPGWRYTGLLDASQLPKTVYKAYQQLSSILQYARYLAPVDYGPFIEAYAFRSGIQQVHVLWSKDDQINQFFVPTNKFIRAVNRDGLIVYDQSQPPPQIGSEYLLEVGFSPIYLVRYP